MVPPTQTTLRHWHRTVVLFSVALLIAWNFATIFHQLDLPAEHHSQHHCQMFAGVHHGLIKSQPSIQPPTYTRVNYQDVTENALHIEDVISAARSPPHSA